MLQPQYKSKLDRYSVSTCRAPWAMAEQAVLNTIQAADPMLCGLTMWPIKKGAWEDAEWLVVATFRKLPV